MGVNTRRKKEKKCLSIILLIFLSLSKNIQKVSPNNDNLNKQNFQVLKHFLCFEKETFKYPDANFPKKQLNLNISKDKKFKI